MSMTFHEWQLEINRLEAKLERQKRSADQTAKLIESLKALQFQGEQKKEKEGRVK